jgi:hypothetical protein
MRNNQPLPLLAPNAAALLTALFTGANQIYEMTFGYANSGAPVSAADLLSLATAWVTEAQTDLLACLSEDITFTSVRVADASGGVLATQIATVTGGTGTVTAHAYPGPVAASILRNTNFRGQHGRGRISMPGVPLTFVTPATDPNALNSTAVTAYTALIGVLANRITASQVWSPFLLTRPVPGSPLVTRGALITAWLVDTILGSARRRKEGRGI